MKALFSFLAERLKKLSPNTILLLGVVYILSLAGMDYHMPLGTSFTLFYFGGIALVAWAAGPWQGVVVAVVASSAIFLMEWSMLRPGIRSGAILWNYSSRILLFAAAAWLTAEVTRLTRRLAGLVEERTTQWKAEAQALQVSQRQLADAMDLARLASWEYDVATALFTFDPRFYGLYATTAEREGGNQMSAESYAREFLYPEDAHLVSEAVAWALATSNPNYKAQVEHRIRRRDGATRHLVVRVAVTKDAAGRTVKLRGVNQDITERKLMEEALRQSESQNRAILAAAMDGFAVVDRAGRLLDVNAAYSRMSGYTREELLRMTIADLEAAESPAEVAQHAESLREAGGRFESRHRRKDGQEIDVEVSVSSTAPLGGQLCCFTRDITERKQAEQRLLEALELNRTLIAASTLGIAAFKASGECILANEALARMIGGSFLHKSFRNLESWQRQGLLPQADEVLSTRQPREVEFRGTTSFGKEVFLNLHFTPFVSNAELHLLLLVNDIAEQKRAEEALKLQSLVLQNMAEGVLLLAPDMTIQFANPALESTFGYEPGGLLGKEVTLLNAWPAEESARFNQQVARSAEASGLWRGEYLNRRKNGTLFTSEARISTLKLHGQTWFVCVQQDITDRKRAEETLKNAQRLQKALLDNIPDPAWLKDPAGRFLACNEPLARFYGRKPEDILGRTVFDLVPWEASRLAREDKEAIDSGKPVRMEDPMTDTQGQAHWFDIVKSPLFNERGEATGTVGIARETTQRHQMEEALRESEERYRSLVNNLNVGIYRNTPGPHGHFIQANPALARMHGYDSLEEFQKTRVSDHYQNPGDRKLFLAHLLREGTVLNYELRLKQKSSAPIFASITATAHRNPEGEVDWIDGVIEDITERKCAEFLLRAQRDLAASLSLTSDLNTAFNGLLEIAVQMEGIDCGGAYLVDQTTGAARLVAHRGVSLSYVQHVSHIPADSPQSQLIRQGHPVFLPHHRLPFRPDEPKTEEGLRAVAVLPLCHEGKLLGALTLASHVQDEMPAQTRVVLEAFATHVAGAIARIRAEDALRQSEARLRAIITTAPVLLFAVDRHGIITFEDGQALKTVGFEPASTVGRPVLEVYAQFPAILENSRRALRGEEFSSVLEMGSVFLDCYYSSTRDKDGQVTGYIGVAINITERQRLERQILEISDREQARIGQDLHDGLCQQLVSLAFDANSLKRQLSTESRSETVLARRIADLLDEAITEARQLARGLFPIRLETDGLPSALEELAKTTHQRHRIQCRFLSNAPVTVKSNAVATHLYRIAQEAVNNAIKHARPRKITIRLLTHASHLELKVEDNGTGAATKTSANSGMGLHIMDYRARSIGGTLLLAPGRRGGTTVSCCVPWPRS